MNELKSNNISANIYVSFCMLQLFLFRRKHLRLKMSWALFILYCITYRFIVLDLVCRAEIHSINVNIQYLGNMRLWVDVNSTRCIDVERLSLIAANMKNRNYAKYRQNLCSLSDAPVESYIFLVARQPNVTHSPKWEKIPNQTMQQAVIHAWSIIETCIQATRAKTKNV